MRTLETLARACKPLVEQLEGRVLLSVTDLVGYWKLDDGAGSTAVDSSGNSYNGALAGTSLPTWTTGQINGAIATNGVDQRVTVPDNNDLDLTSAITISGWVQPTVVGTQYLVKKARQGTVNGYELGLSSTGKAFVRFNQLASADTNRVDSTTSYPTDGTTWMHLAATYDGTTIKLYVNGTLEASAAKTFTIQTNTAGLGIGAEDLGFRPLNGKIDEVKIFNRALTAAEVNNLRNLPPTSNAGPDLNVVRPGSATLNGSASDDGLPTTSTFTNTWSKLSGPGTVSFGNPSLAQTTAMFSADGAYVLRLTATDGALTTIDDVNANVFPPGTNIAPSVNAGIDLSVSLPGSAALDGTVTDDGLPNPPGALTTAWSKLSGPGTVSFASASAVDTTANFSTNGTYVLRLTASDGSLTTTDDTTIVVSPVAASAQSLSQLSISANTGEKPQSKVWQSNNTWFAVLPTGSGTSLFRLDGTSWTSLLQLSVKTNVHADTLVVGNVVHVLLYNGAGTDANAAGETSGFAAELYSLQYVAGSPGTYQAWPTRPAAVTVPLSAGVETATIDIDSTGRMWMAQDTNSSVEVRWSDSPYSTWSAPITLASGLGTDDISSVVALPGGNIGVFWSNQNTQRFGFRIHADGAAPGTWAADEVPAAASALAVGNGMADDHMNLKATSDGTLYVAVKTSYDTIGQTDVGLLVRRPNGTWDPIYTVDSVAGTRPNLILNETEGTITVVYTNDRLNPADIVYKRSLLSNLSFTSAPQVLITGPLNNVTTSKQNVISGQALLLSSGGTPLVAKGVKLSFGATTNATLSGRVFDDLNANGTQDAGENGLSGLTVWLDSNDNGIVDNGESTQTSGAQGQYSFTGLAAGSYVVRENAAAPRWASSLGRLPVTVGAGGSIGGLDFANAPVNVTLVATDATGTEVPGDPAAFLVTRSGPTTSSLLVYYTISGTATNGSDYDLLSGTVTIAAGASTAPITITPHNDNSPEGDETVQLTLASDAAYLIGTPSNDTATIIDNIANGSLSGLVFNDGNGNGQKDAGENGLSGVPTWLDANDNGVLDQGEVSLLSDAQGQYSFTSLVPGNYVVRASAATGRWLSTSGRLPVTLPPGGNITGLDFGDAPVLVTLAATDANATEVAGNTAQFLVTRNGPTTSALAVNYTISGSAANGTDYDLLSGTVTIAAGASTAPITITPHDDNVIEGNEMVSLTLAADPAYTVGALSSDTATIADNTAISSLSGLVFDDISGDGVQDGAEAGLSGASVYLDANDNGTLDQGEASVLSGANGEYSFTNLTPGDYVVRAVPAAGRWLSTSARLPVTLAPGGSASGLNFGDAPITVTLAATDSAAAETGGNPGVFQFTRTGPTTSALTVNYTISGTATNGVDYNLLASTVTIPVGASFAAVSINPIDDTRVEGVETVGLALAADPSYTVGAPSSGTVSIADDAFHAVLGRSLFYNRSIFDGNNTAANAADDGAIDPSKTALFPGQSATFANYSGYSRGLNGVMIDIANLANPAALSAADFTFKIGNTSTPGSWVSAPAPVSVTVRSGAGVNGSDRVTIIWADAAIKKRWLQVTTLANSRTGLISADVFYFGNSPGETGNSAFIANVDSSDVNAIESHLRAAGQAPVDFAWDINKDGRVGDLDKSIALGNFTGENSLPLKLIKPPASPAASITAGLLNDTGSSNSDGITADPSVTGNVTNASSAVSMKAGFDSTPSSTWINVISDVQIGGAFTLSQARMQEIYGSVIPQGPHTLHLQLLNAQGLGVASRDVTFTLDSSAV